MTKPAKPPKPEGDDPTYEQAIARLEEIIERIEGGEVGLEESIAEYERGMGLVARCRDLLSKAEQRIEELARDADQRAGSGQGAARARPMDRSPPGSSRAP